MHRTTLGDFELTVVSDGTTSSMAELLRRGSKTMCQENHVPDAQNRIDTD